MWLYVTVLFGDPVDLTQLKLQLETAVTSKKLKEMIYKIKNIVAKRGNLPNGEPLWGKGRRSDLLEIVQLVQSGETSMERIARVPGSSYQILQGN